MKEKKITKLHLVLLNKGVSGVDLAEMVGVLGAKSNVSRINKIKLGKSDLLCYNTLVPICKALGVTPNDIIEGDWK